MSANSPLISVIIPVYNVENYLSETLLSVCQQTYQNLEILLIDDGSTDNSGKICDEFAAQDQRIKVIHQKNKGISGARNTGLEVATGEFITFVDSDDIVENKIIEILLQAFDRVPNIGIVCALPVYRFTETKRKLYKEEWNIKEERIILYQDFNISTLNCSSSPMVWGKLYRKELLKNTRFREGVNNEDTLYMFDLSSTLENKKLNMLELPISLYHYRYTPQSITTNLKKPLDIDIIENLKVMLQETTNLQVLFTLKKLYYNKIYSFNLFLLLIPGELGTELRRKYQKKYHQLLKKANLWDIFQKTSLKLAIKYLLFRNKKLYYHLYKWTLYKKYQKGHSF